jgi:acyl carrier protein
MNYLDKVKEMLDDMLGVTIEEINPTDHLADDLGCDSLDLIEFVMYLEEDLDIEIPDEDAGKCKTVQDVADLIARIHKEQHPDAN